MKNESKHIIIEGVTESGEKFRPSDWAERMSGSLSTIRNHRIVYSPMLRPSIQGGHKCIVLDPNLKNTDPALYKQIMDFATANKLQVRSTGKEDD